MTNFTCASSYVGVWSTTCTQCALVFEAPIFPDKLFFRRRANTWPEYHYIKIYKNEVIIIVLVALHSSETRGMCLMKRSSKLFFLHFHVCFSFFTNGTHFCTRNFFTKHVERKKQRWIFIYIPTNFETLQRSISSGLDVLFLKSS